jgi:signal-transduction protein with cAMP-binding, CBS, and nucleotidyltransferase domain
MKLGLVCETRVVTTSADTLLPDAALEMRRMQVGALVVVEQRTGGTWPIGIVTDRDLAATLTADGRSTTRRVGEVMSRNLVVASEDDDFFDGLTRMRRFGVRRLPIVGADGCLRGIITLDDVIDVLSAKLREAASVVPRERRIEARLVATVRQ